MLTWKEPLQMNSLSSICMLDDTFGKRIQDSYALFSMHFSPEQLLFLMRGQEEDELQSQNMTQLVNINNYHDNTVLNMGILNQFISRIMAVMDNQSTYQDYIYISTFLNKAGIRNVAEFIEYMQIYLNETSQTVKFVELYQKDISSISLLAEQLFQFYKERSDKKQTLEYTYNNSARVSHTNKKMLVNEQNMYMPAVYSYTNDFSNIQNQLTNLYGQYMNQEQSIFGNPDIEMMHINPYECTQIQNVTANEVYQKLIAAVLLNVADSVYAFRLMHSSSEYKLNLSEYKNLSEMVASTTSRFLMYHSSNRYSQYSTEVMRIKNEFKGNRYKLLEQLITRYHQYEMEQVEQWNASIIEKKIYDNDVPQINNIEFQNIEEINNIASKTLNQNIWNETNLKMESDVKKSDNYLQNIQINEDSALNNIAENQIQVAQDLRKNILQDISEIKIDRNKARKAALQAIQNQEMVLQQVMAETTQLEKIHHERNEHFYEGMSVETQNIFEKVNTFLDNPEKAEELGIQVNETEIQLYKDIQQMNEEQLNQNKQYSENKEYSNSLKKSENVLNLEQNRLILNQESNTSNAKEWHQTKMQLDQNIHTIYQKIAHILQDIAQGENIEQQLNQKEIKLYQDIQLIYQMQKEASDNVEKNTSIYNKETLERIIKKIVNYFHQSASGNLYQLQISKEELPLYQNVRYDYYSLFDQRWNNLESVYQYARKDAVQKIFLFDSELLNKISSNEYEQNQFIQKYDEENQLLSQNKTETLLRMTEAFYPEETKNWMIQEQHHQTMGNVVMQNHQFMASHNQQAHLYNQGELISQEGDVNFVYGSAETKESEYMAEQQGKATNIKEIITNHNYPEMYEENILNQTQSQQVLNLNDQSAMNGTNQLLQEYENKLQTNVERTIEKQLSNISERVYSRLEKKLSSERKRRGY